MADDTDRRRNVCYLLGIIALIMAFLALVEMAQTTMAALASSSW